MSHDITSTPSTPSRSLVLAVAILGALPTIVALFFSPALILDDIQFATTAQFEGISGFFDEISYRPGQGLLHGLQFTAFGTNATLHLVLLAAVNALNAVLGLRLARLWLPPRTAVAVITVWLLLPDRGSTRYWASTVPNHVALALVLFAALLISRRWRAIDGRTWMTVGFLLTAAVLTYEASGLLAIGVVLMGIVGRRGPVRPGLRQLVAPALVCSALVGASLFVLVRSPRGGASTLLADPTGGLTNYLTSLDTVPLGLVGPLLLLGAIVWAIVDHRPSVTERRWMVLVGAVVALAGLVPFLVAGFNVQNLGVLDRSLFFANIGTALVLGAAASAIEIERRRLGRLGRGLLASGALLLTFGTSFAVIDDLGPFRAAWNDQNRAALALLDAQPDQLGLIDAAGTQQAVLVDVPIDDGVAWAHYGIQVQDLYQLVNHAPEEPLWLGLTWEREPAEGDVAVTIEGTQLLLR